MKVRPSTAGATLNSETGSGSVGIVGSIPATFGGWQLEVFSSKSLLRIQCGRARRCSSGRRVAKASRPCGNESAIILKPSAGRLKPIPPSYRRSFPAFRRSLMPIFRPPASGTVVGIVKLSTDEQGSTATFWRPCDRTVDTGVFPAKVHRAGMA